MPRFFVNPEQIQADNIVIYGDDVKHISKVLRLKSGDKITICNRQGTDYECIIKSIGKENINAEILSYHLSETEPNVKITLFQALTKSDKMDLIIQKAVEVGIHKIVPVITERTVIKIEDEKRQSTKLTRWQKISESAAKQSQRGIVPEVTPIVTLKEAIHTTEKMDLKVIAYEKETHNHLRNILRDFDGETVGIFIGPEGGFDESEIDIAREHGIIPITLGKRILRTETAGLFLGSIMMYEMGEV
ncbi:MAG: rRNA (uracil1498-N3)-methyltransferase [Epulopiscium sp.]|jgi:16S rRNA (uracil1498-N3)-methyltransferase|uniref:Ribosomal RNA small subunit methyltransferase E n=1 Tax=Defluviitalea raffinosedens TaxID=1450156 RepID=A0A7C8HHD9_9FIRM|nr:16S rRNA (uracil(1498)-N(3))-methyltransferase [Defluviitalea raffinosedens]MBZ4668948.1 methyltransferase, RsmE family [Defluviitaleaceae bacterium]MDK2788880.1 rRNA (uracil1498-N3)-methyltransferase [Candidatus Epulonipiscium sp.]KAE9637272.1 16S rRNA (uracil(1498)-N(3))-methyltransferase [Defluviitalea raffinosedens]MBM7685575.1 16S rRNA (uracil1498-N3)-methyltransferase [Defluviitalea raffinosedens]HHW66696.1 16S rRNA (uracil(1498)-N(3))-methyltransferase [Candidatus Epulonipiscium sp.]